MAAPSFTSSCRDSIDSDGSIGPGGRTTTNTLNTEPDDPGFVDSQKIDSRPLMDTLPDDNSDTLTVPSSIREGVMDGGRRYHAYHAGQYPFPNDAIEQDRDDLKHEATLSLCSNEYFYAPIHRVLQQGGAECLDLGTGTGKWVIEVADLYPNATWTGTDLSPIQPSLIPPNAVFIVDDIEHSAGWDMPENHFDYIHIRHTIYAIRDRDSLLRRLIKHLKPGGWFEIQEFVYCPHGEDKTLTPETAYRVRDWMSLLYAGLAHIGHADNLDIIRGDEPFLEDAGFVDVQRRRIKCPLGTWPRQRALKHIGEMMRTVVLEGLVGLSKKPLREGLGWTPLQIEMFLLEVRQHLLDDRFHAYLPFYAVIARKPLDGEEVPTMARPGSPEAPSGPIDFEESTASGTSEAPAASDPSAVIVSQGAPGTTAT